MDKQRCSIIFLASSSCLLWSCCCKLIWMGVNWTTWFWEVGCEACEVDPWVWSDCRRSWCWRWCALRLLDVLGLDSSSVVLPKSQIKKWCMRRTKNLGRPVSLSAVLPGWSWLNEVLLVFICFCFENKSLNSLYMREQQICYNAVLVLQYATKQLRS